MEKVSILCRILRIDRLLWCYLCFWVFRKGWCNNFSTIHFLHLRVTRLQLHQEPFEAQWVNGYLTICWDRSFSLSRRNDISSRNIRGTGLRNQRVEWRVTREFDYKWSCNDRWFGSHNWWLSHGFTHWEGWFHRFHRWRLRSTLS